MQHELILQNIQKHILLSQQEINYFVGLLTAKTIAKKEFVLKEGELCTTINFVCTGILRAYYMDASGRESTIMFALSDWWITGYPKANSFLFRYYTRIFKFTAKKEQWPLKS